MYFYLMLAGMVCTAFIYALLLVGYSRLHSASKESIHVKVVGFARALSGWLMYLFWMGMWFSPQPRICFTLGECDLSLVAPIKVSPLSIALGTPFLLVGVIMGLLGLKELSFRVASHEEPKQVVTGGVYSLVRHPQYLGGLLAHVGISLILSALYSLLATPLVFIALFTMAKTEEKYLLEKFGSQYRRYMEKVSGFLPLHTLKR